MQKNGNGLFAIIDEGDAIAEISAASKNDESYYNYVNTTANIFFSFILSLSTLIRLYYLVSSLKL